MSSDLYFNSIKYISAKRAGEITGYSSDYIGQLCRGKKLTTQRVGKSWYVSEESLNQYVAFAAEQARLVREIQSTTLKEVQAKNTKVATAPATPVVPVISITSPASTVAPVSTSAVAAPVITEIVTEKLAPVIKIEEKESKATVTASNFKLPTSNLKLKASSLKSQFTKTAHSVAGKFYSHYPLILSKLSDSVRKNHSLIYGDVAKKAFGLAFVFLFGFSLAGATTYFRADLAKLPKKGYAVLSDINTFYAKKLTTLYIQTGEQVLGSTSALVSGVQDCGSNPALCIRKSLSSVATLQANNVDTAGKKILAFVENTHAQTFAYVSSALDFSDLKNTTVAIDGPHQGALDGDHQLAQVSSAKQTVVDKAGVAVYTEVQSWFEKTGGALLSLLGQKNSYVVVAPSTKSTPANTITLAPTKKVVASVPTYNPSVIVKNTNTIIERVVESNASAASLSALDQQIKDLSGSINNRFAGLSTGGGGSVTNVYQQIANTQRIDQLHNTTINNPTIIGGSIDAMRIIGVSTLNSDVLNTGTLTAGTFTASTSTFNGVTYFAGNVGIGITNPQYALDILGNINLTGGITAAGSTIGGDFAVTGTTTLNKLVATSATSTNLFATNSIFANSTTTNAYITSLFAANATTTNAYITSLITAGASSTNAYATNFTANNATVGNLVATSTFSAPTLSLTGVAVNSLLSTNSAGLIVATSTPTFGNFNATSTTATSTLSTGGLAIGGSQFIVQQNSGNVGIGTATPGAKLEISNSDYNQLFLRATSVGGSAALEMKTTVGNPFQIFASGTDTVSMYSGGQGTLFMGTSKVGINSGGTSSFGAGTAFVVMNGNAGIGTTTPLTRLSVFGDSLVAGTETASSFIATSTTATSTFAGGLAIATNRFVVDRSTGNVGVGTASPTELLDVRGNIIIPTGNAYRFGDSSVQIYRNTVPSNSLTVAASGGVMFNGNIGIGSTTPGYRLSVAGSGFFDGGTVTAANIIATSSLSAPTLTLTGVAVNSLLSTNSAGLIVATSTPTFGNFIATSTTATSTIAGGLAVQTNKLIVDRSTGFVGINTPTPTSSLHVNGDMRLNSGSRFYFESTGTNNALYRDISSGSSVLTSPADIIFGSGSLASTYMTVKQSGNVGIGTTTPSNSLTVSGSANFGTNGTFKISDNAGNNYALGGPSSNILSMDSNSFLIRNAAGTTVNTRFGVGGGVAIGSIYGGVDPGDGKLFASNNIGIGTTSPQQRLEVAGNLAFTGALMPNYQAGVAGTVLMSNGTGVAPTWTTVTAVASSTFFAQNGNSFGTTALLGTNDNQALNFETNGLVRQTILANGNVGVGTTAPSSKLQVVGGAITLDNNQPFQWLDSGATARRAMLVTAANDFQIGPVDTGWGAITYLKTGTDLVLSVNGASGAFTNAVTVKSTGNFGIGTTSPQQRLEIAGNLAFTGALMPNYQAGVAGTVLMSNGTGVAPTWTTVTAVASSTFFAQNGNSFGTTALLGTNDAQPLALETSGVERMRITSGGNVGIGTTTPFGSLAVNNIAGQPGFVVGSSTGTSFIVDKQGNVGVGTVSPTAAFDVGGKFKISTVNTYSGTGTGTTGAPRVFLGTNTSSGDDAAILIGRAITGDALFSHAIRDESTFSSGPTDSAYASFDSNPVMQGSLAYNHFRSFQARPNFSGSVSVGEVNGYGFTPIISSGNVTNLYGLNISNGTGAGTVTNQVGIWINDLTKGSSSNFAIYSTGSAASYLGGNIQSGGTVQGVNLKTTALAGNYGQITSVDSAGQLIGNPNLTIVNGVLQFGSATSIIKLGGTTTAFPMIKRNAAAINFRLADDSADAAVTAGSGSFSGNLGIGTTSPQQRLEIAGNLAFTGALMPNYQAGVAGTVLMSNGTGVAPTWTTVTAVASSTFFAQNGNSFGTTALLGTNDNQALNFETNSLVRQTILANGNVGIGTTTPITKLEVGTYNTSNSNIKTGSLEFQPYAIDNAFISQNTYFDGSFFRYRETGSAGMFYFLNGEGVFRFYASGSAGAGLANSGNNTQFKVNANGTVAIGGTAISSATGVFTGATLVATASNVGIGSTTPVYPFVVEKNVVSNIYAKLGTTQTTQVADLAFGNGSRTWALRTNGNATADFALTDLTQGSTYLTVVGGGSGNVGIGTNTPTQKLDVAGIINSNNEYRFNNASFSRVATIDTGGGFGGGYNFNWNGISQGVPSHDSTGGLAGLGYNSAGTLRFFTNSSATAGTAAPERMRIDASGNVGIGTTTPAAKLDVFGGMLRVGTGFAGGVAGDLSVGRGTDGYMYFGSTGSANFGYNGSGFTLNGGGLNVNSTVGGTFGGASGGAGVTTIDNVGGARIYQFNASAALTNLIQSNGVSYINGGNVGIGTSSPTAPLSVASNSANVALGNISSGFGAIGFSTGALTSTNYSLTGEGIHTYLNAPTSGNIYFRSGNSTVATLGGNGSFTLNGPTTQLIGASGILYLDNSTNNSIVFRNTTGYLERMRIDANGNVGIGSTTPGYKFSVAGSAYFDGGTVTAANIIATSSISAPAFTLSGAAINSLLSTNSAGLIVATSTPTFGNFNATSTTATSTIAGGFAIATNRFVVDRSTGNVGIGTTSPTDKLVVVGQGTGSATIGALGAASGNYTGISLNNTVSQTGYNFSSSPTDQTLYINRPTGNSINFRLNNTDQMILTSAGNLGIGVVAPSTKLEVAGSNVRIGDGYQYEFGAGTVGMLGSSASGYLSLRTGSTDRLYINSSGNIGVSSSTPTARLSVKGAGTTTGLLAQFTDSADTARLTILDNGSVGIATSSPNARLSVDTTTAGNMSYFGNVQSGTVGGSVSTNVDSSGRTAIVAYGGQGASSVGGAYFTADGFEETWYNLNTRSNASGQRYMRFGNKSNAFSVQLLNDAANSIVSTPFTIMNASGNVGIGSTTPTSRLTVSGGKIIADTTLSSFGQVQVGNATSNGEASIGFISGATNYGQSPTSVNGNGNIWAIGPAAGGVTGSTFGIYNYALGGNAMNITSAGNVGIGNTSPNSKLNVQGDVSAQTFTATSTTATSTISTGGFAVGTSQFIVQQNSGNVGIGTLTPGARLHVSDTDGTGVRLGVSASNYYDANIQVFRLTNQTETMRITSAGNLGIGTTSPQQRLEIAGNLAFTGALMPNYQAGVAGTVLMSNGTGVAPTWTTVTAVASSTFFAQNGNSFGTTALLGTNDNQALNFETNGLVRQTILANGNVGIATTSPLNFRLQVLGNIGPDADATYDLGSLTNRFNVGYIRTISGGINSLTLTSTGNNVIINPATATMFQTGGVERARFDTNGNLGIGTTTPATLLHVEKAVTPQLRITHQTTSSYGEFQLAENNLVQGGIYGIGSTFSDATRQNNVELYSTYGAVTLNTNNIERLRVTNGGNVGIGTSSPAATLSIQNLTGATTLAITGGSSQGTTDLFRVVEIPGASTASFQVMSQANSSKIGFNRNGGGLTFAPGIGSFDKNLIENNNNGGGAGGTAMQLNEAGISFATRAAGSGYTTVAASTRMFIDSATGNVGIGTTTPDRPLTFAQTVGEKISLYSGSPAAQNYYGFGVQAAQLQYQVPTSAYHSFYTGTTERVRFDAAGNVGIGTNTPTQKLDVAGIINSNNEYRFNNASFSRVATIDTGGGFGGGYNFNWNGISQGVPSHDSTGGLAGLGYNSAGTLRFFTNSSATAGTAAPERMRIDASGNVGIGTSTPVSKLDIVGGAVLIDNTRGYNFRNTSGIVDGGIYQAADNSVRTYLNGSDRLTVTSTGNVGIGTTAPGQKLQVGSIADTTANIVRFAASNSTTNGVGLSFLKSGGTDRYFALGGSGLLHIGANPSSYSDADLATAAQVTINNTGNVGIGTTIPGALLDVQGTGSVSAIFNRTTAASQTRIQISNPTNTYYLGLIDGTNFGIANAGNQQFTMLANGNVGIGTSTPNERLNVVGNTRITEGSLYFSPVSSGTATTTGITPTWSGKNFANAQYNGPVIHGFDGGALGYNNGTEAIVLRWNNAGNVGIGTTSPQQRLEIAGNLAFTGALMPNYQAGVAGTVLMSNGTGVAPTWTTVTAVASSTFFAQNGNSFGTTALLGTNDAQPLALETSGVERMRITSGGNVGIGTTSPTSLLSIAGGDITLGSAGVQQNRYINLYSDNAAQNAELGGINFVRSNYTPGQTAATITFARETGADEGALLFKTRVPAGALSERLRINASGNVGIGTSTPTSKLDIVSAITGEATSTARLIGSTVTTGSEFASLSFMNQGSDYFAKISGIRDAGGIDNVALAFSVKKSGGGPFEAMRIDKNGNIGIGTTTPDTQLVVSGAATALAITNVVTGSSDTASLLFRSNTAGTGSITSSWWNNGMTFTVPRDSSSKGFLFNSNSGTTRMFIDSASGNVGIGSTTPGYKLSVAGSGFFDGGTVTAANFVATSSFSAPTISLTSVAINSLLSTNSAGLIVATSTPTFGNFNATSTTATSTIGTGGFAIGSSQFIVQQNSGNVGVGTSNPTEKLVVQGNIVIGPNNASYVMGTRTSGASQQIFGIDNNDDVIINRGSYAGGQNLSSRVRAMIGVSKSFDVLDQSTNSLFTVLNAGNVGIGTTTPNVKLSVQGNIGLANNSSLGGLQTGGTFVGLIRLGADNKTYIGDTTTGEAITVTSGNVGIGTSSPAYKLDVWGVGNSLLNLQASTITNPVFARFANNVTTFIGTEGSTGGSLMSGSLPYAMVMNQQSGNALQLGTGNTARLTINSSGNVGIGTTSPTQALSVSGSGYFSGNVGVGISTPTFALQVIGGARFQNTGAAQYADIGTTDANNAYLRFFTSNSSRFVVGIDAADSSKFKIGTVNDFTTTRLTIDNSGNVGIATTSPWAKFAVQGTVAMNGLSAVATGDSAICLSAGGEVRVNTGVSTCTVSSAQFKHSIATSSINALDLVNAMRPVTYVYNGDATNSEHFGFIAEEVNLLEPRLVAKDSTGAIRSFRYEEMTSVLTKAVQELSLKTESMNTRLTALEATVASSTAVTGGAPFSEVLAGLEGMGARFTQGIAYLKNVFVENLTVGTPEKPTGITLYDDVTGDPYCLKMSNGAMVSAAGLCPAAGSDSGTATTTDTVAPVISLMGNNPAEIQVGTSYVDLGATVSDMGINPLDPSGPLVQNNNLGLQYSVNGVSMTDIVLDTSATSTNTIVFSAVDQAGNWGHATRTVEVIPVQ